MVESYWNVWSVLIKCYILTISHRIGWISIFTHETSKEFLTEGKLPRPQHFMYFKSIFLFKNINYMFDSNSSQLLDIQCKCNWMRWSVINLVTNYFANVKTAFFCCNVLENHPDIEFGVLYIRGHVAFEFAFCQRK